MKLTMDEKGRTIVDLHNEELEHADISTVISPETFLMHLVIGPKFAIKLTLEQIQILRDKLNGKREANAKDGV